MGNSLPLAGVESSSMDHRSLTKCITPNPDRGCSSWTTDYHICGRSFPTKQYFNFDEYWETCGEWYEDVGITKEQFSEFPMRNGFRKGDIIIVWGWSEPEVGDIIVFNANKDSTAPYPIIHRVVSIENGIIQTKGDHNGGQLTPGLEDSYNIDETRIREEQIIGKAILKVPYLGWVKILAVDLWKAIF
jgi:signal peptidase I